MCVVGNIIISSIFRIPTFSLGKTKSSVVPFSVAAKSQKGSRNGCNPSHLRTSYNLFFSCRSVYWELKKHGCESEFIVGSFENRICMYAQVKFDTFS